MNLYNDDRNEGNRDLDNKALINLLDCYMGVTRSGGVVMQGLEF